MRFFFWTPKVDAGLWQKYCKLQLPDHWTLQIAVNVGWWLSAKMWLHHGAAVGTLELDCKYFFGGGLL